MKTTRNFPSVHRTLLKISYQTVTNVFQSENKKRTGSAYLDNEIDMSQAFFIERVAVLKIKDFTVSDFKTWSLAVLTGDRINEGYFIRKCMAVLPSRKKVAVITR